jgi:hypothetical protein
LGIFDTQVLIKPGGNPTETAKPEGYQWLTHVPIPSRVFNELHSNDILIEIRGALPRKALGEQHKSSNVVAELFDFSSSRVALDGLRGATHPSLAEVYMCEFMNKGEGPRGPGVVIIDDNKRYPVVGKCESPKYFLAESGVIRTKISDE